MARKGVVPMLALYGILPSVSVAILIVLYCICRSTNGGQIATVNVTTTETATDKRRDNMMAYLR
jgi:hypothetical protein